jgi:hypothetical protein
VALIRECKSEGWPGNVIKGHQWYWMSVSLTMEITEQVDYNNLTLFASQRVKKECRDMESIDTFMASDPV